MIFHELTNFDAGACRMALGARMRGGEKRAEAFHKGGGAVIPQWRRKNDCGANEKVVFFREIAGNGRSDILKAYRTRLGPQCRVWSGPSP